MAERAESVIRAEAGLGRLACLGLACLGLACLGLACLGLACLGLA